MEKNKFVRCIKASWLCLRFPFLYPRNRFNGKHWVSYTLNNYLYGKPSRKEYRDGKYLTIPKTEGLYDRAFDIIFGRPAEPFVMHKKIKNVFYATWFYIVNFITFYILPIFHCIPSYTELDAMDHGWRKAFGIQMCKDIRRQLIREHRLFSYRIMQIKEKWGVLCWYDNGFTYGMNEILNKYEELSSRTCIICGGPAKYRTPLEAWRCPYCEKHVPDYIAKKFLEKV